ncbi:MAG: hypothetical protein WBV37_03005, partial [Nocardioidaceae bacterium]
GTADQPWQTLAFALSRIRQGEVLYVHGGTYTENIQKLTTHYGTPNQPIYVTNVPGERPVLKGAISLSRPDYWNFSGLNVTWDPDMSNPPSFMVKIGGGIGWSWRNSEFSGSLSAGNMYVGLAMVHFGRRIKPVDPKQWTLAGNCFHGLRPGDTAGKAANLVLGAMHHPKLGTVERNLFFNNENQDNIAIGSADSSPRNVLLRYNTIYGGRFALRLAGGPKNIRITRNLIGGASSDVLVRYDGNASPGTRLFQNLAVDAHSLIRSRIGKYILGTGNVLLGGSGRPGQTTAPTGPTGSTTPTSAAATSPPVFSSTDSCDGFHTDLPAALPYGRDAL